MTTLQRLNVHVYPAPIVSESRIFRQTRAIARAGLFDNVEICGTPADDLPDVELLSDGRLIRRVGNGSKGDGSVIARALHQIRWSRAVYRTYSSSRVAAINAHSVAVLPVAALLARRTGARLIYDTHELETKSGSSRGIQGLIFRILERALIRRCDAIFVVNDLIRDWYLDAYPGTNVLSIVNSPLGEEAGPAHDLRATFGIPASSRLYVHVGNIGGARHIPEIVDTFVGRPEDHIVFLGDGPLRDIIESASAEHANIHWHPQVDSSSVVPTIATADVGVCLIEPTCLSYALSLPNKAIEYSAAGIPFVRNDLPAVDQMLGARLTKFKVTSISADLPKLLDTISPVDVTQARLELADVALPQWDVEAARMIDAIRSVLTRRRAPRSDAKKARA